jgi:hypothetical protein
VKARAIIVVLCLFFVNICPADIALTQDERSVTNYAPGAGPYKLKIRRQGNLLMEITIPKGVYLSVESYRILPKNLKEFAEVVNQFDGDVTIRIRPADEVEDWESSKARDIMAKAPSILDLKQVEVDVEMME